MAKKKAEQLEQQKLSIEEAVALHLHCNASRPTAKQCMKEVLVSVQGMVNNQQITVTNIKKALESWFRQGWATLAGGFLQITRAGRARIKELADKATASPALA